MGAAIEREASAVLKEAEDLAQVDTPEELVALLLFTCIVLLLIWIAYRLDSAPVWELENIDEFVKQADQHKVLFAGSWNPPHAGHVAILRALAKRHGLVYACVGHNAKKAYTVSAEQRAALVRAVVDADPVLRGRVKVITSTGYVWRDAKRLNCVALYRGIRSWRADGMGENVLHALNLVGPLLLGPGLRPVATRYLAADAAHRDISSSKVRRRVAAHEALDGLVPRAIKADVRQLYAPRDAKIA